MPRLPLILLTFLILTLAPVAASAAQQPVRGTWRDIRGGNARCLVAVIYPDGTRINFGFTSDGVFGIAAKNSAWGLRNGQRVPLLLTYDTGARYSDTAARVINGFASSSALPQYSDELFASARTAAVANLTVDGRYRGTYSLAGSRPAMALLDGCRGGNAGGVNRSAGSSARTGSSTVPARIAGEVEQAVQRSSRSWILNQYVPGSVSQVELISGSVASGNFRVRASYLYNVRLRGSVQAEYRQGSIYCLYFWDFPDVCRR